MNDLDLVLANEVGDLYRAQNAERISDRDVKDILRRKERKTMLPVACRPKCDEDLVPACAQAAAKIDEMPLGPAVMPGG